LKPENADKLKAQPIDPDLPGLGQHYCVHCAYVHNCKFTSRTYGYMQSGRVFMFGSIAGNTSLLRACLRST
jgi:hypothetical protein